MSRQFHKEKFQFKINVMKRLFYLAAAAAFLFSSCNSENPDRYQDEDIIGTHDGIWTSVSLNGEPLENPQLWILDSSDKESRAEGSLLPGQKYAVVPGHYVALTKENGCLQWDKIKENVIVSPLVIPIEITNNGDDITFEGTTGVKILSGGETVYSIKGRYGLNQKKVTVLSAEVESRIVDNKLVGKTFELGIDEKSIYPRITVTGKTVFEGKEVQTHELLAGFYEMILKNYRERSGIDAIRFTFNDDGAISVAVRDMKSGSYTAGKSSRYSMGFFEGIVIMQDTDWANRQVDYFSPSGFSNAMPCGLYWTSLSSGETALRMICSFDEEEMILTPEYTEPEGELIYYSFGERFLRSWYGGLIKTEGDALCEQILKEIRNKNLYFIPKFKTRLVKEN